MQKLLNLALSNTKTFGLFFSGYQANMVFTGPLLLRVFFVATERANVLPFDQFCEGGDDKFEQTVLNKANSNGEWTISRAYFNC